MTINPTDHACVIEIAGRGVLIRGASGSGKTALLWQLLSDARAHNQTAKLVADDRIILTPYKDGLKAKAPDELAGKMELYGFGIVEMPWSPETTITLVVDLVTPEQVPRMPEPASVDISGIELPLLLVPQSQEVRSARLIWVWFSHKEMLDFPFLGVGQTG